MKKYNKVQIEEIVNNPYVLKCWEKGITFSKKCKLESIKLWSNGLSSKEIFRKFNFPEYIINSQIPKTSICRWNKQYKKDWEGAFWSMSKRWRKIGFKWKNKININELSDKEKIEYYQTENAYLKELFKEKHWFYP